MEASMKRSISSIILALLAAGAFGAVKLDSVFSSNMVLQQEKPIAFFGTADPGSEIQVGFNGKTVKAKADDKGGWKTVFPAMKAGKTAYTVTVTDGKDKLELKDILIGEVWFCSGQSNMQMPVGKVFRRGWSAQNCEQEVAAANYPEIRYAFQRLVPSHNAELPAQYSPKLPNGWVKCSPATVPEFSATAYFFGRKLYQDLQIPIGLINASWGGTRIEPWISPAGYEAFGPESDLTLLKKFRLSEEEKKAFETKETGRFAKEMAEWHQLFEKAGAEARAKAQDWSAVDFDASKWKAAKALPSGKYLVRWYRMEFELPKNLQGKNTVFAMGKAGEKADIWLNGKPIASWNADDPESRKKAIVKLTPEQFNQTGKNVLAVRCEYFYGGNSRALMNQVLIYSRLTAGKDVMLLRDKWKMNDEFACTAKGTGGKKCPGFISVPYKSHQFQSSLYNGMVAAWTKLPVRGVIWYQGCSNNGRIHYYPLHKTLIADWRARWNQPDMPFLIVQLAGYEPARAKNWQTADPNQVSGYPLTRDIQLQMLQIPNVGLACLIDIGEAANIHPANKQDVGKRLALEAERIAYGKNIVSRGPLFESAKPEGNSIRVTFKYADNGLKTSDGKAPNAFAVAGADGKFVWADARIDGKTVVVSSAQVKEPKFVRYAYMGYRGDCNLQNAEGLPAYPFRSDAVDYSNVK
jgi:sialate O-acetylesterase